MKLKIALLAGDGIGPEVTQEAVNVLDAVAAAGGHTFDYVALPIGGNAIDTFGTPLPGETLQQTLQCDAALLGAVGDNKFNSLPPSQRPEAGLLKIRSELGGFANLRPATAYKALADNSPLRPEITEGVDIMFVRELLGGLYFGQPRLWDKAAERAHNTMVYTHHEVDRVARIAFQLAQKRRKKVTSVDKANVLETSQMWRYIVDQVAKDFPDVTVEHQLVDSMAIHLMNRPRDFDVVLTENLFGDILSDESGVITGSLGMLPSATLGGKVNLYEPVHGSAPDIAGQGKANPIGAILTAAMVLRHSAGLDREAKLIESSVVDILEAGYRTGDIARGDIPGQTRVSTTQMGELILEKVEAALGAASL
jgi:3-isopropylmalate dehydrogenase